MHILQLINSLGFFGAENVLLELAKELNNKGFKAIVGCFKDKNNSHIEVVEEAIKYNLPHVIFNCNGPFDLKTFPILRKYIREHKIDVVHSHNYKSNFYSLFTSSRMNVRHVSTCHNWPSKSLKMRLYESLDKILLRRFDKVIAVSDPVKEKILNYKIPPAKVKIIQNGINVKRFNSSSNRKKIREEFGIPERSTVIGTVGRLTEEKGHSILIRAAADIAKQATDIVYLIIGDGPLMPALKKEAGTLPVIFAGLRDDMPEVYSAMDIFTLPSLNEGLPMVLLEAMASKKPVIATNVGNISSVVDHKKNGLLVEAGDSGSLEKAILYLLKDRERSMALADNGYAKVINCFSSDAMAKEYAEIYREIL